METSVGKRLKQKINARKITNNQIAKFINLSPDTVKKLFTYQHIEIDRLIQFSELLGEDLVNEFYYSKEPLKSFKEKELAPFITRIAALEAELASYKKEVQQLEDHINTQKQLIETQAGHIKTLQQGKSNK